MRALGMALLACGSVGLWTVRVTLTQRDNRPLAALVAAVEAMFYLLAVGRIVADLTAIDRLLGYGIGVAAGTYLGMGLDRRLTRQRDGARPTGHTVQPDPVDR